MAKRAKVGDVIQLLTSKGMAYAQFTHKHKEYGHLLAIFEGFHTHPPENFSEIVNLEPQFHAFFPLQTALNQSLVSVVTNTPVAETNQAFPMFRTCSYGRDRERGPWWFWDGDHEQIIDRELTDSEKKYSLRGIITAPLLIERVEMGYRPEIHDV